MAKQQQKKTDTSGAAGIAMTRVSDGAKWTARSQREADELVMGGFKVDDPKAETGDLPVGGAGQDPPDAAPNAPASSGAS